MNLEWKERTGHRERKPREGHRMFLVPLSSARTCSPLVAPQHLQDGAGIVRQLRWQREDGSKPSPGIPGLTAVALARVGYGTFGRPSWQSTGPGLTSELMLSALGFTRTMVSRISLWWQRVLWPEGEMQEFVLKEVGID